MPPVNHFFLASGAVVAVSVAVAAAIAIYESPDVRRYTEDVRRRIAIALQSMQNGFNPALQQPRFNRPEDAEGFLQSRGVQDGDPGVDADEESRRRQREELLYWNSVRLQSQQEKMDVQQGSDGAVDERRPGSIKRGTSFDDFLKPDESAERGAFIFNSGFDVQSDRDGLRRRGNVSRAFNSALYTNPFADEHHIDNDEVEGMAHQPLAPGMDEIVSDIYSATTRDPQDQDIQAAETVPALIDIESRTTPVQSESSATLDRDLADNEYMTAGQEDPRSAYASIQAWAHESSRDFYSPLPVTPAEPMSEPELISDGELTPTDSASLVGSGEDIANDALSSRDSDHGRVYDVMSESEGIPTPSSWSEVGSVISENEVPIPPQHA